MRKLNMVLLAVLMALPAVGQEKRMAVVEFSTSYLRQKPDYESPLESQELMGTVVEIVGEQGYWREIISPQPYRAWCTDKGLVEMDADALESYVNSEKVMFMGLYGHVHMKPSMKSRTLCDLVGGDVMRLVRKRGRWTEVMLPSGKTGFVPSKELKSHDGFKSVVQGGGVSEFIDDEMVENVIASTLKLLGSPYLWGGMSAKGVDCSGLVRISYIMNGILLPRNASQQINCGERIDVSDLSNLERGDLVFFGSRPSEPGGKLRVTHVGIYLGDNHIIHSSHCVRINSLVKGDEDYYENAHRLIAAIRL